MGLPHPRASREELKQHYAYKEEMEKRRRAEYAKQAAELQAMADKNKTIYETVPGFADRRGFNGCKMETFKYGKELTPEEFADRDTPGTSPDVILGKQSFAQMLSRPMATKPQPMAPRGKWREGPNTQGLYATGEVGIYDPSPHKEACQYIEREWGEKKFMMG